MILLPGILNQSTDVEIPLEAIDAYVFILARPDGSAVLQSGVYYSGNTNNTPPLGQMVSLGVDFGSGIQYYNVSVSYVDYNSDLDETTLYLDGFISNEQLSLLPLNPDPGLNDLVHIALPSIYGLDTVTYLECPLFVSSSPLPFIFYGDENMHSVTHTIIPSEAEKLTVSTLNNSGVQTLIRPDPPSGQTSWGESSYMVCSNFNLFELSNEQYIAFGMTVGVQSPLENGGNALFSILSCLNDNFTINMEKVSGVTYFNVENPVTNSTTSLTSNSDESIDAICLASVSGITFIFEDGNRMDIPFSDIVSFTLQIGSPDVGDGGNSFVKFYGKLLTGDAPPQYSTILTYLTPEESDFVESWNPTFVSDAVDPYWENVVSLLHFDGDSTDEKGKLFTEQGGPLTYSMSPDPAFNEEAVFFTNWLEIGASNDFDFGLLDFTIEGFITIQSFRTWGAVISSGETSFSQINQTVTVPGVNQPGGRTVRLLNRLHQANYPLVGTTTLMEVGVRYHFAITRESGVFRAFLNGVLEGTRTVNAEVNFSNQGTLIGRNKWDLGNGIFNGNIDELRITKGVARYTENFTPPTEPFPNFGPLPI